MTEQIEAEQLIKSIGELDEAYYAALGEDAHTARAQLELGHPNDLTSRELAIKKAGEANGFARGVAAGVRFAKKGDPEVERIIKDNNERLDKGEVLPNR